MPTYKINPETENVSIQVLIDRINRGYKLQNIDRELTEQEILQFNDSIIIAPDYQREYRFTHDDETALIESVLVGIPIPPVFLATDKYKKVRVTNVVDGQHRLRALYRFKNNIFRLNNLKLLKEFDGKGYEDLDVEIRSEFSSAKIITILFKDFPGIEFELEIFNRYNKGTKPLSPQEIRHAVYNSQLNSFVNDFTYNLFNTKQPNAFYLSYNVTKDRIQKKKVQEGIFVILSILENGINEHYEKSLTYAESYMKEKSNLEQSQPEVAADNFEYVKNLFLQFNKFIDKIHCTIAYPFSKEIYGISSRNYKFQISIAMILAGLFYKAVRIEGLFSQINDNPNVFEELLDLLKLKLKDSFLEDPNYNASSTNSKEINKLLNSIELDNLI
jgi:hypothetical protein